MDCSARLTAARRVQQLSFSSLFSGHLPPCKRSNSLHVFSAAPRAPARLNNTLRTRTAFQPYKPLRLTPAAKANVDASNRPLSVNVEECDALIVGGGPSGLGAALLLSERQGWDRIVLLESRAVDTVQPDRSYTYMIDGRGRTLLDAVGLTDTLQQTGLVMDEMKVTVLQPDGFAKTRLFEMKDHTRSNIYIPRRDFLAVLRNGLAKRQEDGRVQLLHGIKVTSIQLARSQAAPLNPGEGATTAVKAAPDLSAAIIVHARDVETGREISFAPRLLIGADGLNSVVLKALESWAPSAGLPRDYYSAVQLNSPSAGLQYKVLPLPPNPPYRQPAGGSVGKTPGEQADTFRIDNTHFCVVDGVKAPENRAMRLGLTPLRNRWAPRTANIIRPPDHTVWACTTGAQLRDFLQESFPQLDIPALFTQEQLEAAAESRGGVFPKPQYLRHFTAVVESTRPAAEGATSTAHPLQQVAPGSEAPASDVARMSSCAAGVALVGDAMHSFPPDLAQGVNSAMLDVVELMRALDEAGGDLQRALASYEERRAPEAAAIAELMVFGGPYQYMHKPLQRTLWSVNVAFRLLLSKLAPWAFHPQTFMLIQQPDLSYSEILHRVHATTRRIMALLVAVIAAVLAFAVRSVAG